MATTWKIVKVRTERPHGAAHEHITMVEIEGNPDFRLSRAIVIADIRARYGDRYITYAGGMRAATATTSPRRRIRRPRTTC